MYEVDIRKFFDNLDHSHLRQFLRLRVRDGVLLRLIDKWLKAGVMEDGSVSYPESGSPQGGVISPMLSNVFLHYVLDLWFEQDVKPRLRRDAYLIRYADDFVIGFRDHRDAQRVMDVVPKRFGKYGLTVHPHQDQACAFPPPVFDGSERRHQPDERPGTFDLLGFTHYWGSISARPLGCQTQDGIRPLQPSGAEHRLVVSGPPALVSQSTATEAEREVTRTLRVLRCDGELGSVVALPPRSRASLAEVAESPQPPPHDEVAGLPTTAPEVSADPGAHLPLDLSTRSEPLIRGTVCANARTYGSVGAPGR